MQVYIQIFLALNQFPYRTRIRSLTVLVSNSLSPCSSIELIDVTLADQDAFSKVVDMFADVEVGVVESSDDSRVTTYSWAAD